MSNNSTTTTTIKLNVGGVFYEVPRSLFERYPDTMLGCMVKKHWENHDNQDRPMFIDRDGERFRYVLDYMRDKEANLPITISMSGFLKDMIYFGFEQEEIESKVKQGTLADMQTIATTMGANEEDELMELDDAIQRKRDEITTFKCQKGAIVLARTLYNRSTRTTLENNSYILLCRYNSNYETEEGRVHNLAENALKVSDYFSGRLLKYGLVLVKTEEKKGRDPFYEFVLEKKNDPYVETPNKRQRADG